MATVATAVLRKFADDWENALPSAVLSGIVGDPDHMAEGGYHVSREDQPSSGDYSIQLAEDREGPSNAASAVDMNHSAAEMALVTRRLLNSAQDQNDPRLNYCREFYGTLDGKNVTGWDTYYGSSRTSDRSHLWHIHLSFLRKYVNDPIAMAAVLSVIKGETVAQWLGQTGGQPGGDPGGGGSTMALGDLARLGDDPDGKFLIWRIEAFAWMRDTYAGGPHEGWNVPLVQHLKQMGNDLTTTKAEVQALKEKIVSLESKIQSPVISDAVASQIATAVSAQVSANVATEFSARPKN